jgi:hypothetical protein
MTTDQYADGILAGVKFVDSEWEASEKPQSLYWLRDFRANFSDAEWEMWEGSPGEFGAAEDIYFIRYIGDRSDPMRRSCVPEWWALILNPDTDPDDDVGLTREQETNLSDVDFVRGFVDGVVHALRQWPGDG